MKKILLLNGGKQFAHSDGRLNETLHDAALAYLDRAGFDVKQTFIDGGYDIKEEVQKYLWADVIIYQMPGWWMGARTPSNSTWMKCSPKATAASTPATAGPAPTLRRSTAVAA